MAVKCPLCGFRFNEESAKGACSSCPVNSGCGKICCPNCHYSWLETSPMVGGLISLVKKGLRFGRP